MLANKKPKLSFKQIRHLHGLQFEALCHQYNEQELYELLKVGESWYFWPSDVVLRVTFVNKPGGEATMVQLNEEMYLAYYVQGF